MTNCSGVWSDASESYDSGATRAAGTHSETPLYNISNYSDAPDAEQDDDENFIALFSDTADEYELNSIDACDDAVKDGSCLVLIRRLRSIILSCSSRNHEDKHGETVVLQIASVCSTLVRIMECSDEVLRSKIDDFEGDLVFALSGTVRFVVHRLHDSTSRSVALGSSVQIMRRVAPFCLKHLFHFGQSLTQVLGHSIPSDVRVDAACAITQLLDLDGANMSVQCKIEQESSTIISILSTAALTRNQHRATETLKSLCLLAKDSALRCKLRRRRCVVIAVAKQLKQRSEECRHIALEIVSYILKDRDADTERTTVSNLTILAEELVATLRESSCHQMQVKLIRTLPLVFNAPCIDKVQKRAAVETLNIMLQDEEVPPNVKVEACAAFLIGVNNTNAYAELMNELSLLVVSPLAAIRNKVLLELHDAFFWHAKLLSEHTHLPDLLDSLCILLTSGSPDDCTLSMQLYRQIMEEEAGKKCMCQHNLFLHRLVALVVASPVKNRPAYINAVEIILELLASDERLPFFLPMTDVLPWMVSLANVTSDDPLKHRLVGTILRFAKAKLNNR